VPLRIFLFVLLCASPATYAASSKKPVKVNLRVTRTVTTVLDLTRTTDCGTTKKKETSTVKLAFNAQSDKVLADDNGIRLQLSARGNNRLPTPSRSAAAAA
jgi:hypothetical protein